MAEIEKSDVRESDETATRRQFPPPDRQVSTERCNGSWGDGDVKISFSGPRELISRVCLCPLLELSWRAQMRVVILSYDATLGVSKLL